jgi:hypothetical protein
MTPYLDAGFLITLLIKTPGSRHAREALRRCPAPFFLNFLHQLQTENFLVRGQTEGTAEEQRAALEGNRLWRQYVDEGVFQFRSVDWEAAFRVAITWNRAYTSKAPAPLLLLHPALAAVAGASHFLSFDPRSRQAARAAGLRLLPENL